MVSALGFETAHPCSDWFNVRVSCGCVVVVMILTRSFGLGGWKKGRELRVQRCCHWVTCSNLPLLLGEIEEMEIHFCDLFSMASVSPERLNHVVHDC